MAQLTPTCSHTRIHACPHRIIHDSIHNNIFRVPHKYAPHGYALAFVIILLHDLIDTVNVYQYLSQHIRI